MQIAKEAWGIIVFGVKHVAAKGEAKKKRPDLANALLIVESDAVLIYVSDGVHALRFTFKGDAHGLPGGAWYLTGSKFKDVKRDGVLSAVDGALLLTDGDLVLARVPMTPVDLEDPAPVAVRSVIDSEIRIALEGGKGELDSLTDPALLLDVLPLFSAANPGVGVEIRKAPTELSPWYFRQTGPNMYIEALVMPMKR